MEHYVSFHKIMDYLKQEQENSPRLNNFGYGDIVYFVNDSGTTTTYPFLFITPINISYAENTTTYSLQMIFADIVNTDLSNEIDVVSDMSLEARRFLSVVKRGFLDDKIDVVLPSQATSFFERFNDHVGGVVLNADIVVFEDINACDPYPTPTPTSTVTPTPTITPTPTPTCTTTQQHMEVELQDNTKFKLILWNESGFTSTAVALCDYVVSGTAYGSLGTTYTGTETIFEGQHQHQFDLASVLLPGEVVTGFTVYSVNTSTCVCPVKVNFYIYWGFETCVGSIPITEYLKVNISTIGPLLFLGAVIYIAEYGCIKAISSTYETQIDLLNDKWLLPKAISGSCAGCQLNIPTPTPTPTSTS